jgi:glutathione S-transferase
MTGTSPLIFHHYDFSNFAEKIRLIFGLKQLEWLSVETPMYLPKPDLTALTGGYRKVPVLQIGADVYCDTAMIAAELERRFPDPSIFPGFTAGLAQAITYWAEKSLLWPTARFATGVIADDLPAKFHADRAAMWGVPMNRERYRSAAARHRLQMLAQVAKVESMLKHSGKRFLLGDEICLADFSVYHPLWFVGQCATELTKEFAPFVKLQGWMERVHSVGHGKRMESSAAIANAIAATSRPTTPLGVDLSGNEEGFSTGERVVVTPMDYGQDKVEGQLHRLTQTTISIRLTGQSSGTKNVVSFPFEGYRLKRMAL